MATRQATTKTMEIKLAHSPDSDDAFMFYALATNRVKAPGLKFTHVLSDIETLNRAADQETCGVDAVAEEPKRRPRFFSLAHDAQGRASTNVDRGVAGLGRA